MAFYNINEHVSASDQIKLNRFIADGVLIEVKGLKEDAQDGVLKDKTIDEVKKNVKKVKKND